MEVPGTAVDPGDGGVVVDGEAVDAVTAVVPAGSIAATPVRLTDRGGSFGLPTSGGVCTGAAPGGACTRSECGAGDAVGVDDDADPGT